MPGYAVNRLWTRDVVCFNAVLKSSVKPMFPPDTKVRPALMSQGRIGLSFFRNLSLQDGLAPGTPGSVDPVDTFYFQRQRLDSLHIDIERFAVSRLQRARFQIGRAHV